MIIKATLLLALIFAPVTLAAPDSEYGNRTDVENMTVEQFYLCQLHADACEFDLFVIDEIGIGGDGEDE